jgi:pimeloyl-ACP methyl ester carboxylesterase
MATGYSKYKGHRTSYETYGKGKRAVLLVHGLLLSRKMQEPLAHALAEQGNMCITVDLPGHGQSDKHLYNWDTTTYAEALVKLLDDLGIDQAVILGTSLGSNIALQIACEHPDRVRGLVLEMPALENAVLGGGLFFTPVAVLASWARPLAKALAQTVRMLPEFALPMGANMLLEMLKRDPESTVDVLKGLFYGPLAPSKENRSRITQPALVIGHRYDPIHPYADAKDLAEDLPDGRMIDAMSVVELRLTPKRLTDNVIEFVDDCWRPKAVDRSGRAGKKSRRQG